MGAFTSTVNVPFFLTWKRGTAPMAGKRFILNAGRTTKQGQQINVGKDHAEYQAIVSTLLMHPEDMKIVGVRAGGTVRLRSDYGEAVFQCREGKVPQGMLFVPYGPPTCRLMGGATDGTGMPTSKGWEVEVEPVEAQPERKPGAGTPAPT
jgi:formylmethanofuran dehydrogenase subunit D